MTTYTRMEEDWSHMTESILHLTVEVISLLAGESFPPVKSNDYVIITVPITLPLISKKHNKQKVLEVIEKMMKLLTGEVPIRCQDVTVCFSKEEWQYIEGHKDSYKDFVMENWPLLTSPGHMTTYTTVEEDWSHMMESILHLTLEVISLLAGESFPPVKSNDYVIITVPTTHPLISKDHHKQKVLEVIRKMMKLLTGEVPIRCQDVTVCFSKEEWQYIEGHKELYKDFVMENWPPLTSPDMSHRGEILPCSEGDKSEHLTISQKVHSSEKPFSPPDCGKSISSKPDPTEHPKHHPVTKAILCAECGKSFKEIWKFVVHQRVHTGEKPFACLDCGQCFSEKGRLNRHQRCHTGERPYSCSECGNCFSQKQDLFSHQRCHTGEKPFSCSECGWCFRRKDSLIRHQRRHTGVRPHSCSECGKCFTQKQELILHQRRHTGEKPYLCSECGKSFVSKAAHSKHQRVHTSLVHETVCTAEKRFSC
ncbi:zinc finger protein OZF-like [Hyperolius riggenbachi]|uniref:zinc finger protein OZF-like n=1 Tax=Hyperolius riggenbachi TaxID=752182 RepID=UPI0035A2E0C5